MHKLNDLIVWQKAIEISKQIYLMSVDLPSDEKYGLVSQMKRSAISIPSNIAEGAGRNSNNEFQHFLGIANGSAYELQTQLLLTKELKLIKSDNINQLLEQCNEIQKMIYALKKRLSSKAD